MKTIELTQRPHEIKIGQKCEEMDPNVREDTLFTMQGEVIGAYIRKVTGKLKMYADYANVEFRSKRVPKSTMRRSSGLMNAEEEVFQYSTILGFVPKKPNMGRNYTTISSVHKHKEAANYVKAMLAAGREIEKLIQDLMPKQYQRQLKLISQAPERNRFGKLFSSAICNYNISANYHRDTGNVKGSVNAILIKKKQATGGHLHVPDYDLILEGSDDSLILYPAWKSVHGVTPIHEKTKQGYRNSLVWYPLNQSLNE